ncbi:hypothetical protein DFP73DRAFT_528227 [Morchella snyderi]|nr:hypothetical protein DFP73DRAFT_528227 [Morchella snyderi]
MHGRAAPVPIRICSSVNHHAIICAAAAAAAAAAKHVFYSTLPTYSISIIKHHAHACPMGYYRGGVGSYGGVLFVGMVMGVTEASLYMHLLRQKGMRNNTLAYD